MAVANTPIRILVLTKKEAERHISVAEGKLLTAGFGFLQNCLNSLDKIQQDGFIIRQIVCLGLGSLNSLPEKEESALWMSRSIQQFALLKKIAEHLKVPSDKILLVDPKFTENVDFELIKDNGYNVSKDETSLLFKVETETLLYMPWLLIPRREDFFNFNINSLDKILIFGDHNEVMDSTRFEYLQLVKKCRTTLSLPLKLNPEELESLGDALNELELQRLACEL